MPLAIAVTRITKDLKQFRVTGTVTPSGNYPTTGDSFSPTLVTYPIGFSPVPSSTGPVSVVFSSQRTGAAATNCFVYEYNTTLGVPKMQVFTGAAAQTALTELSAGAYPAGVLADTIVFEAIFDAV